MGENRRQGRVGGGQWGKKGTYIILSTIIIFKNRKRQKRGKNLLKNHKTLHINNVLFELFE